MHCQRSIQDQYGQISCSGEPGRRNSQGRGGSAEQHTAAMLPQAGGVSAAVCSPQSWLQRKGLLRAGHHPVRPGGRPSLSRRRPNSFLCRQASTVRKQTTKVWAWTRSSEGWWPCFPNSAGSRKQGQSAWECPSGLQGASCIGACLAPTDVDEALQAAARDPEVHWAWNPPQRPHAGCPSG